MFTCAVFNRAGIVRPTLHADMASAFVVVFLVVPVPIRVHPSQVLVEVTGDTALAFFPGIGDSLLDNFLRFPSFLAPPSAEVSQDVRASLFDFTRTHLRRFILISTAEVAVGMGERRRTALPGPGMRRSYCRVQSHLRVLLGRVLSNPLVTLGDASLGYLYYVIVGSNYNSRQPNWFVTNLQDPVRNVSGGRRATTSHHCRPGFFSSTRPDSNPRAIFDGIEQFLRRRILLGRVLLGSQSLRRCFVLVQERHSFIHSHLL